MGAFCATEFKKHMATPGLNVDQQPGEAQWCRGVCESIILLHETTCEGLGRAGSDMTISEIHNMGAWCQNLEPDPCADDPHMARLVS